MLSEKEAIRCELLVLRFRRGDSAAMEELIRWWERPLLYYINRLIGSEADAWDILQETWAKALKALRRMDQPRAAPALLYQIARSAAIGQLRKNASRELAELSVPDPPAPAGDPADDVARSEDAAAVHRALSKLSLPHREVLTLHFLQDLSVEEMAALTGVVGGTIKSRLFYAKRALRDALEAGGRHE